MILSPKKALLRMGDNKWDWWPLLGVGILVIVCMLAIVSSIWVLSHH